MDKNHKHLWKIISSYIQYVHNLTTLYDSWITIRATPHFQQILVTVPYTKQITRNFYIQDMHDFRDLEKFIVHCIMAP